MKKLLLLAIFTLVLTPIIPAHATEVTQFEWDRTGAEHLPCAGQVSWVLSFTEGIINATVGINDADGVDDGHAWTMLYDYDASVFYIISTEPVAVTDEVLIAYTGDAVSTPELTLTDCTPAEVVLPVEPPVTPPTEQPAPPTTVPTSTTWDIGFRVTTVRRTNVVVKWRIVCDGVLTKGKIRTRSPVSREFTREADECHILVRAWDVKPFAHPNDPTPPFPRVTTWVIPS